MFHFTYNLRHIGETRSDSLSRLSYELFHSTSLTNFIYQLSAEVLLVTMSPRRRIKSFLQLHQSEPVDILKMKLEQMKGKLEGWVGGGAYKNGVSSVIFSPPPHFLF